MTRVISELKCVVFGTTRDECVQAMDEVAFTLFNEIGGAPWLVPDDDIKKIAAEEVSMAIADDQGFCYVGLRTWKFRGPVIHIPDQAHHDGFKVQGHYGD